MFVTPDKMPGDSRIWIYQSDRELSNEEENKISILTTEFLNTWTSHNLELRASFEIRYHIFLILMIDQNFADASGCSIDKSIHFIQKLEKEFSIALMNRLIFALKENEKVRLIKRNDFEKLIEKEISINTIVFNNLIESKSDLEIRWQIPIKESWHGAINRLAN